MNNLTETRRVESESSPFKRKYSALYSNKSRKKPGPKGPDAEVIDAIVTMK